MPVGQAGDFRVHHQRLDLALQREVFARAGAVEVGLPQPLDLDFADGVRHPLGGLWLRGFQEDFGGRLREHHLGHVAVDELKLGLALEAKHKRVLRFPVLGDGGVELRQALQAGQLVQHKPDRVLAFLRFIQETQNQQVNPQTMQRTQCLALAGFRGKEDPALPVLGPIGGGPMIRRFVFARQHPQAVGDQSERGQDAVALLLRALRNHHRHLGILDAAVDLVGVRHPLDQLLGRGAEGQQMGEDFLRRLGEKLALLIRGRLVERRGNGLGFGTAAQLLGRPPIGAAGIQRIQNDVAVAVIEPLNELAGRVVHDGRMAPFFDLQEQLHDEPGLARARIAHQLDVLPFGVSWNAHELLGFDGFEANTIAFDGAIESVGETSTGPFSRRPYFISLNRRHLCARQTGAI